MKKRRFRPRTVLAIFFTAVVFCILTLTMLIVGFILYYFSQVSTIQAPRFTITIAIAAVSSILVGTFIAFIASHIPLRPFNILIEGMNKLASGNYDTQIDIGLPQIGEELTDSFNKLAAELRNTEMLSSDFINNFSHEFKTPIVSIRGFAKLLKKGNLTQEKQKQYIDIIATESSRLADMTTSILNLTKYENQNILTGVTRFNLSEQLRSCVLLFEKTWEEKQLSISAEFEEYFIYANEEMLKHVWINLFDNAIKFSPNNGTIQISIRKTDTEFIVSTSNDGAPIDETDRNRIFQKFYKTDTSHSSEGTGIGLTVVKNIVQLHRGQIAVDSKGGTNTFIVTLPIIK